jgi:hypothetical protein
VEVVIGQTIPREEIDQEILGIHEVPDIEITSVNVLLQCRLLLVFLNEEERGIILLMGTEMVTEDI